MFGFLGEKLIPPLTLHYQHLIISIKKNISKKRAKGLHNSIYPLIFAPRLRDNASDKKEVWVSG